MAHRTAQGRPRANPDAETHVASLLALFRAKGLLVVHVLHDDPDPASPFRRGTEGAEPMPCAQPLEGEVVVWKSTSSAFAGTGLDALLRRRGVDRIVLVGAVAAFCVTSTIGFVAEHIGFRTTYGALALVLALVAALAGRVAAADGVRKA